MPATMTMDNLQAALRGALITPGSGEYEEARKLYNAMIDKKPRVIVRARDAADVISTVNFARDNDLPLAIRGGGHNVGGLALVDDGVVADLSSMKSVRVDPRNRIANVEGGCDWGDVDHAGHPFGLAVPTGIFSTTGVGGLTLGGGVGYLTRKHGLTIDNLLSADVVTAEGKLIRASAEENPDLFWALRGGGGNFGVVTNFEFRMHPVSTVYAGPIFFPVESAGEVLRHYREFMPSAAPELGAFFAFQIVPPAPPFPEEFHNRTTCLIMNHYSGPADQAEKVIDPIRKFAKPLWEHVGPAPHPAINSLFDALLPYGQLQQYWKSDYIQEIPDEAIQVHLEHGPKVPTFQSTMHIYPTHGAAQKVGKADTAYSYREANYIHNIVAAYPDPADTPKNRQWVREYWDALRPYSSGGAYVNFLGDDEGEERVKASYRDNYTRLAKIKKQYDPGNLFRVNQNIKPAA